MARGTHFVDLGQQTRINKLVGNGHNPGGVAAFHPLVAAGQSVSSDSETSS